MWLCALSAARQVAEGRTWRKGMYVVQREAVVSDGFGVAAALDGKQTVSACAKTRP